MRPAHQRRRRGVRIGALMDGVVAALAGTEAAPRHLVADGDEPQRSK